MVELHDLPREIASIIARVSSLSLTSDEASKDTNIDQQVIEYLMKKGYARTEQVLRQESAQVDRDGRPVVDRADYGNEKYIKAFELLSSWIDSNLDIYKVCHQNASCMLLY